MSQFIERGFQPFHSLEQGAVSGIHAGVRD
jgi:hypothetical protein